MHVSSADPLAILGTGFLGTPVALAWDGAVVGFSRNGRFRAEVPLDRVSAHALDVTKPIDPEPMAAARVLLVCVAAGRDQDRRAVYLHGTERLLEATRHIPWKRIVFISSTSALPDLDGWVDETCKAWPVAQRGRIQREAEQLVAEFGERTGTPWFVLRLGGLYGPQRPLGAIYRRRDETPLAGDGNTPTNLIHLDDAVTATLAALRAPASMSGVIHVTDDDKTPRRDMYADLAAAQRLAPVEWSSPRPPGARPHGKRVSNLRMKTWLGVKLSRPSHTADLQRSPRGARTLSSASR